MRKLIIAAVIAAAVAIPAAATTKYQVSFLGNANSTTGVSLNDLGHVVSYAFTPQFDLVSTLNAGGQSIALGGLGGGNTRASDLNNFDQVVGGSSISKGGASHAFLYSSGAMNDLGTLGGANSNAVAINNAGAVVGVSDVAGADQHAFLYTAGGGMKDLGTLGGNYSEAMDVNANGDVIGRSLTANSEMHTFLYSNGVMTDLTATAGLPTDASYLRFGGNGEILGQALDPWFFQTTSFTYANNQYTAYPNDVIIDKNGGGTTVLNSQGWGGWVQNGTEKLLFSDVIDAAYGQPGWADVGGAVSINALGQILAFGTADDASGASVNYTLLLTPVPEPETWAMLAAGLGLLGWRLRRKHQAATA